MKHVIPWAVILLMSRALSVGIAAQDVYPPDVQFLDDEISGDFDLVGQVRFSSSADLNTRVLFNFQAEGGQHYALALIGGTAKFYHVAGGDATHIGTIGTLSAPADDSDLVSFSLQRRDWRMTLTWGDRVVVKAYDARLQGGEVGTVALAGGSFEELMIQPVGDIFLTDDFLREEGATGDWEPASGRWQQRSLRDDEQAGRQEADKSANAFSYMGRRQGDTPAISVAGYWFWDIYSLEAAVQPGDENAVGLVFHFQDTDNYMLLRWLGRNHPDGGRLQLVAVRAGQSQVIADSPGGFRHGQWYALGCAVADGVIHAWVDGELRLVARTDLFGHGQIGLYCESRTSTFFDDVVCGPWELFTENFAEQVSGKWNVLQGRWKLGGGTARTADADTAMMVTGRTAWDSYRYSASIQPEAGSGVGLVVGYRSAGNYCLLRWAAEGAAYAGKAQVLQFIDGQARVLTEAPLTIPVRDRYRAEATLRNGLITLWLDGGKQVEAFAPDITGGAIGLYAERVAGTQFDQILLQVIPPRRTSRIVAEFADVSRHPEMAEWASTRAPWLAADANGTTWWTKGDYFGEHALVLNITDIGSRTGEVQLFIGATGPDDPEACKLKVSVQSGSKQIALVIQRGDRQLAEATVPVEDSDATVSFERRGQWLVALVNGEPMLQAEAISVSPATD